MEPKEQPELSLTYQQSRVESKKIIILKIILVNQFRNSERQELFGFLYTINQATITLLKIGPELSLTYKQSRVETKK